MGRLLHLRLHIVMYFKSQLFVSIIDFNLELDGASLTGSKANSGTTHCVPNKVVTNHFQSLSFDVMHAVKISV